ncbi:OmpA family protein [Spirosoma soli]|uniref:OmpA family protein n=1 Tax=Spirosoma soli TaxID=1770529 RepID=A0ABW5LZE4_9BACT
MNLTWLLTTWLSAAPLLVQGQQPDSLAIYLQGQLVDYKTHQPLDSARFFARTASRRQKVGTSDSTGMFTAALPFGTTAIRIERAGYRPQTIPVELVARRYNAPVTLVIPLIPTDKQTLNTPYLQTEQTSYVLLDSASNQSSRDSNHVQHNTFLVTDAIQGKPLSATVCFQYTQTGDKRCLGTNAQGWLQRDFDQKDIVALEVRSDGYQSYNGNLIVEQLNGQSLQHEIRLQRELTLFSVNAPEATHCELRTKEKTVSLLVVPGYAHQYVSYDLVPGSYELAVSYGDKVTRRSVRLNKGLNFMSVNQPSVNLVPAPAPVLRPEAAAVEVTAKPALSLPDTIPMIYFEQGSYQLRPDSQDVLTQVARYLKANPAYTLQITGHTDNVGNPQINQTLSQYRALATAKFLTDRGVPDSRLTKNGIGSNQPIAPNDTETNKALNRRVSLKLISAQ